MTSDEQAEKLEKEILLYSKGLEAITREASPENWAMIQNCLAYVYWKRVHGNRADNLELAIEHYTQALEVHTRESYPEQWAATQINLALAYSDRVRGERADNLELAIEYYRQALKVYIREAYPEDWAKIQNNLAGMYWNRVRGERAENLELAIEHLRQVLEVRTREAYPEGWAMTQSNLAAAYSDRIRGKRADNLELAIEHCQQVLKIHTREAYPEDWATTQVNLASAYAKHIRGDRAENLELGIEYFDNALKVYTREAYPERWALIQDNLAVAYSNRIRGERADNLELAIEHCRQALEFSTRDAYPRQWAATQNTLATAYSDRIRGEQADNLELAIEHYHQALKVYTREAYPEQWSGSQMNLANAYRDRIRGEPANNLKLAIEHYRWALEVRTREAYPDGWANIQNNVALVYRDRRIRGVRAINLERTIKHCRQALEVHSHEAYPEQWAATQNTLALAYSDRIRGDRADNLELAIEHYDNAFKVCTRATHPERWAMFQGNLALAYRDRIRGARTINLELAIKHCRQALEVYTREAYPESHRRTQSALARLYSDATEWRLAHECFDAAIEASEQIRLLAYTDAGRRSELGMISGVFAADAYSLIQLDRAGEGLIRLERGKATLLGEALAFEQADLVGLPAGQASDVRAIRQRIQELETEERLPADTPARRDDRMVADELRTARDDLATLVGTIRADNPDFLPMGLGLDDLLILIPEGGALVAPLVTRQGSAVYVIPHGTRTITAEHCLLLDTFTSSDLQTLLQGPEDETGLSGWLGAYSRYKADLSGAREPKAWGAAVQAWGEAVDEVCSRLWQCLMGPIHERLVSLDLEEGAPVLVMPQGGLGLLPLHAAWREQDGRRRYWVEDYTTTYVPSGFAFKSAKQRLLEPQREQRTLLAVVNPTNDEGLKHTPLEADTVESHFGPSSVRRFEGEDATIEHVQTKTPGKAYLHFSCHGYYNWTQAMESGLSMADGTLSLARIIGQMDLSACRLVSLSACETGITDLSQSPDEFLGLPAGLMQAGAPGVLSTLWSVRDDAARALTETFYALHLGDQQPPAEALRGAQLEQLRSSIDLEGAADRGISKPKKAPVDPEYIPDPLPLHHPAHWAAFTFNGA